MHTTRIISILIISLLTIESVSGQTLTRILRDEINGNNMRRNNLISSSEATVDADADSVPYVGGPNQWRVPLSNGTGFTTPTFLLDTNTPATPTYAIFAIEIQNNLTDGACNRQSSQLTRIRLSEVSIGIVGAENLINVSSYQDGGDSELRLQRMGLTDENNLIRFNIPRMDGDIVQFQIEATNPDFEDPDPLDVCLQVEFLGARITMGSPDPPSINESPLLQYNMNRPGFSYLGNSYDDLAYSGVRGSLYTGGVGVLTDGIIDTDPRIFVDDWVGFSTQGRVRLFLNREYPISAIKVYFWMDSANGAVAPTGGARDRNGPLNQFIFDSMQYDDDLPDLYLYYGITIDTVMLDYLEIPLSTTQGLLITEISLLDDSLNEIINITTVLVNELPTTTGDTSTTVATSSQGVTTSRRPNSKSESLPVETIVFSVVGVVACCCISIIIMVISVLAVLAFVYLRKSSKLRQSSRRTANTGVNPNTHDSLARRFSDKFLETNAPPSYSELKKLEAENYANPDAENIYQDVERPLPLPPVPGEEKGQLVKDDSYIQMAENRKHNLTIDTGVRKLKAMRTFSEDDYMPVTPPSVASNVKQPPQRILSSPYVAVTPPGSPPAKSLAQIQEEKYNVSASLESAKRRLEMQKESSDNLYVIEHT